jgi:hypothetical protein
VIEYNYKYINAKEQKCISNLTITQVVKSTNVEKRKDEKKLNQTALSDA